MLIVASLAPAALLATTGCSNDSSNPATANPQPNGGSAAVSGNQAAAGGAAGKTSSEPAATFSAIYSMMYPMETNARCNACHANPANDVGNGNLHMGMDRATAYSALVGKTSMSSRCMQRPLVVPGHPEMSLLMLKLSPSPPCGSRMPVGGNPFTDVQLEMIRSWIAAGAKND
jgi:hypothetical protein